jgi:hypothetical protein
MTHATEVVTVAQVVNLSGFYHTMKGRKLASCATMNRSSLAPLVLLLVATVSARGQTVARVNLREAESRVTELRTEDKDQILTARALAALTRLDRDVLVYRSLGDFEESGKLARVSFETFRNDVGEITAEVEPLLSRLPQSRLKTEIRNALDSYRDGAFWWQKIDRPRVVYISALAFSETTRTSSDTALLANVPYTVAIYWRQAERYLKRAEGMMNGVQTSGASKYRPGFKALGEARTRNRTNACRQRS